MALAVPVIQDAKSILDMDNVDGRTTCELITTTALTTVPNMTARTTSNSLSTVPPHNQDDWIQVSIPSHTTLCIMLHSKQKGQNRAG